MNLRISVVSGFYSLPEREYSCLQNISFVFETNCIQINYAGPDDYIPGFFISSYHETAGESLRAS